MVFCPELHAEAELMKKVKGELYEERSNVQNAVSSLISVFNT